jgi:hypothetical protein
MTLIKLLTVELLRLLRAFVGHCRLLRAFVGQCRLLRAFVGHFRDSGMFEGFQLTGFRQKQMPDIWADRMPEITVGKNPWSGKRNGYCVVATRTRGRSG